MICVPCAQSDHEGCEDVARQVNYEQWADKEWQNNCPPELPKKAKLAEKRKRELIVTELIERIERQRPQRGCPCHHYGTEVSARG